MLGRKSYTHEELDQATTAIDRLQAAYARLADAVSATSDAEARAALEAFEPLFFNHMALALDRYFVHRIRPVAGKDGNPLNEVELVSESLVTGGGTFRGSKVIKLKPAESVLGLNEGDPISLGQAQFERLSRAFLAELETKFVEGAA
jgi:hypothetical protein